MIITVDTVRPYVPDTVDDALISAQLESIENVIRTYTHNNFQNKKIRFTAKSSNCMLYGSSPFLDVGDTIQISKSITNDGIYTVIDVDENFIRLNKPLHGNQYNLVTKVEYPAGVIDVAISLFKWRQEYGAKIGIKSESETLSRHSQSITYEDSSSLIMGFPAGILSGLALWKKARC